MTVLTKWFRNAGIELTRVVPYDVDSTIPKKIKDKAKKLFKDKDEQDVYIFNHQDAVRERIDRIIWPAIRKFERANRDIINHISTDPHCFEASSAILENWKETFKFYTKTDAFLSQFGLLSFQEEVGGTGGHIHMAVKNSYEALKVQHHMLNHPEILFAFCHPDDPNHKLQNLTKEEASDYYCIYKARYALDDKYGPPMAYRSDYGTLEFRLFDVAQTWEMQEEHMAFAQAFMRYAVTHDPGKLLFLNKLKRRSVTDHADNFEQLIRTLELPWKRYRFYLTNLKNRLEWNTDRLRKA